MHPEILILLVGDTSSDVAAELCVQFCPAMGPKPASAAAGGARSTPGTQQQPSRAVKELQAGLPLVQQPYNEAACVAVMHHMDAAIPPSVDPLAAMRKVIQQQPGGDAGPVLELLNKYWQWFQSGVMQPVAPASSSTATGPSRTGIRSRRSLIMVSGGSSSSRRDIGMEFVCHHLNEVYNFLSAYYDAVKAGEVQAAGIRSQLLASGTGEPLCAALLKAPAAVGSAGPWPDNPEPTQPEPWASGVTLRFASMIDAYFSSPACCNMRSSPGAAWLPLVLGYARHAHPSG